jgi:hypothetical protein
MSVADTRRRKERDRTHERLTILEVEAAKASTQTGSLTARMIMIINGGAAAGLLAFLGTLRVSARRLSVE